MSVLSVVAVYFIVWWTTLFAVLPWGVRSQAETADVSPGTDPGAPARPQLLRKMLITTLISAVIMAGLAYLATSGVIGLEDFPMPFDSKAE